MLWDKQSKQMYLLLFVLWVLVNVLDHVFGLI